MKRACAKQGSLSNPDAHPTRDPRCLSDGRVQLELSGAELEDVRAILLRAIDRERAEVEAGLKDQGVQFGGTIAVSADSEVTLPEDDFPQR
jgi:hypothetical protein